MKNVIAACLVLVSSHAFAKKINGIYTVPVPQELVSQATFDVDGKITVDQYTKLRTIEFEAPPEILGPNLVFNLQETGTIEDGKVLWQADALSAWCTKFNGTDVKNLTCDFKFLPEAVNTESAVDYIYSNFENSEQRDKMVTVAKLFGSDPIGKMKYK